MFIKRIHILLIIRCFVTLLLTSCFFSTVNGKPVPLSYPGISTSGNLEVQVKAAFIINFTRFVYWNPQKKSDNSDQIVVSVYGTDPIGEVLEDFSKRKTNGPPIRIKKISKKSDDISNCNLVFISRTEQQQMPLILAQLEGYNVLTVSDIQGFARHGGMIGFLIENGKVKIEINLNAVNKSGLKISAKLLEVARLVSEED